MKLCCVEKKITIQRDAIKDNEYDHGLDFI